MPAPEVTTLADLIEAYKTDPLSSWHKVRYHTRKNQEHILRRLLADYGAVPLVDLRARNFLAMHQAWLGPEGKKASMAHGFIGKLRTIASYGVVMLEHPECVRISLILNKMKFKGQTARKTFLTAEQVSAICDMAREFGWYSIALAQAFQFEVMLRQKDVIGEYVPITEPGESDVISPEHGKWGRGIRWEEIDENLVLRHTTSKLQKELVVDLNRAPFVMAELKHTIALYGALPKTGPVITYEGSAMPYLASEFRRKWRIVAEHAGIPKDVWSMDSRAGGVTEASKAGVELEFIKHAATHADIAMTQRYSRGAAEKIAAVQEARMEYRENAKKYTGPMGKDR